MKIRTVDWARLQLIFFFALALALCLMTRSLALADDDFPSDVMDSVEPPPPTSVGKSVKTKPSVGTKSTNKSAQKIENNPIASKPKTETKIVKVLKVEKSSEELKPEPAVKEAKSERAPAPAKAESNKKIRQGRGP